MGRCVYDGVLIHEVCYRTILGDIIKWFSQYWGVILSIVIFFFFMCYMNKRQSALFKEKMKKEYRILLKNKFDENGNQLYLTRGENGKYTAEPLAEDLLQVFTGKEFFEDEILYKYKEFRIEVMNNNEV